MAGEYELTRDQDIDLGDIFASVWRNKFRLLAASFIAALLAFVVVQSLSPHYRAETRILIRASDPVLTSPAAQAIQPQTAFDERGVADQIQLLESRTIAMQVISKLKLSEKEEFDSTLNPSGLRSLLAIVGLGAGSSGVTSMDRTLESYYDKLRVYQADRARVIVVEFSSEDPELAAAVPNLIAAEYLSLQEELKRGAAPDELEKLEPELARLRESVMKAEASVEEFRENSDLLRGRDNDTLATQELSELSSELSRVRSQRSRAEANAEAVSRALRSGSLDSAASVLQSPLIQRLRERQVNLNTELAELSTTLLPGHPRIQALRSQLETLSRQISNEAQKIQASLQDEARVARAREEDLAQRRNQLKSEAGRVGRAQVELRSLEREADAQRQLLNSYLVRFKEARARQNRQFVPADAFVFSEAQVPSKSYFPKKGPIIAGAFFGVFLMGAVGIMAVSLLTARPATHRVSPLPEGAVVQAEPAFETQATPAQSKSEFGENLHADETPTTAAGPAAAPAVATMAPNMGSLTSPVVSDGPSSAAIAAQSLAMLGSARVAVIAPEGEVTSAGSVALARILASRGRTSIVLDLTGQSNASKVMLGSQPVAGICDLLAGQAAFSQAIHNDRQSQAHIMPTGGQMAQFGPSGAGRLPTILDALDATYDFLIIDCGSADIGGLRRVWNTETILIIDTNAAEATAAGLTRKMLTRARFPEPIIIHANRDERRMVGLDMAA
ncbi:MAG: Wzz/FepE/Etk N-terminal domain-containing protein [Ahrensia sp.]|nr:Wzz/FepE/Etk N-terminal domain-containing protein [Ahrensia sp.]